MTMTNPNPRPSLSKSADADVHPALPATEVVVAPPEPAPVVAGEKPASKKSKKKQSNPLMAGRGKATSDAIRGKSKDKNVDLGVKVPKSLRKQLRQEAVRRGITVDDLVTILLADRIQI